MEIPLADHLRQRLGGDAPQLDTVLAVFAPRQVKRNTTLLTAGEVCRHVYYVASGCLQVYVTDAEGRESTRDIVTEGHWCAELQSFGQQQPAVEHIRTLEHSHLYAIDHAGFMRMMATVPPFEQVYRQILEASYANSVYRLNTFVALDALERIQWLMQYRPRLMARLPSKVVASYLGISEETFSRLKRKL